jgi:superfamily I DNA and RNA helicase
MLTHIIGPKSDEEGIDLVLERINALNLTGTLYIGFPVVQVDEDVAVVDAFLVCREHGVLALMVRRGAHAWSDAKVRDVEHKMRRGLREALERSRRLSVAGKLLVDLRVITFDPHAPAEVPLQRPSAPEPAVPRSIERPAPTHYGARPPAPERRAARHGGTAGVAPRVVSPASLEQALAAGEPVDAATVRFVVAAVQRLASMKGAITRGKIGALAGERAGILATIDARINELDPWQIAAAVEIPSGPQRIRGLAGTGKTIVLAYKAALLHAQEDRARIALTFYNRSLYGYVSELIDRFHRDMTGKAPNWEKLLIRHCWGAKGKPGIYSEICAGIGVEPIGVADAVNRFGTNRLFESVCENALRSMEFTDPEPIYDVVLIDEAQDLSMAE